MNRFNQKNQINRVVNVQRVFQVILKEQLLLDNFMVKKLKKVAGYQNSLDFLKGRKFEI